MSDTPRTDAKERETEHSPIGTHAHYGWKMARTLERELNAVTAERDALHERLRSIGDYAHDHSTGPAVPDALWEIRSMAYDALRGKEGT